MAQQIINTGAVANDGTGDPLRTAFTETNNNFTEIYTAGPVGSNVRIVNNTILTLNTNGNLVLAPNGVGVVQSNVNIVPNQANVRNLGSSTQRWGTVYAQYVNITNGTIYSGDLTVTGNLSAATVTTPELTVNMIRSDDSTVVNIQDGVEVDGDVLANGNVTADYVLGDGSQLMNISVGNSGAVQFNWQGSLSNQGGTPGDTYSTLQFDSNGMPTLDGTTAYQQRVDYSPYLQVLAPRVESTDFGIVAGPGITVVGYDDNYNTPRSAYLSVQDQATATQQWDFGILGNGSNAFSIQNRTASTVPLVISTDGTVTASTIITNDISSDDSSFVTIQDGLDVVGDIETHGNVTADYFYGDGNQLLNIPVGNNGAVQVAWLGKFSNQGGTPDDTYSTLQFDSNGMLTLDGTDAYQQRVDYSPYLQVLAPKVESTDFDIVAGPGITVVGYDDNYNTPRSAYLSVQDQANATQQWDFGILGNGSNNYSISDRTNSNTWTFGITGDLSAPGNVSAGNVLTSAEVIASGVIQTGTGFSTGGYLSVNGSTDLHDTNIIGNLSVNTIRSDDSTVVLIQDGVEIDGDAVINGNVTGAYILGNGSQLTGLPAIYGNADVTALLSNLGSNVISGTGNITAGNVNSPTLNNSGNISVAAGGNTWLFGTNGNLTLPTGGQIVVSGGLISSGASPAPSINGFGSINSITVSASGNITGGNVLTAGNISATGNVVANNIGNIAALNLNGNANTVLYGNGVFAAAAASSSYGNANVATFMAAYGSNTISTSGNITAGNVNTGMITLTSSNVAIGYGAGQTSQGGTTVAVGAFAGMDSQGLSAVAIGFNAGQTTQGNSAVAIGMTAGYSVQGNYAVAIGDSAGYTNQGAQAIAIGRFAGLTNQANNSIILNATGANLNATTANTFTVKPVRQANTANAMYYDASTGEITYDTTSYNAGTPAWTSAGAITFTATTTNPTKGTTTSDNISYRQLGAKQWEIILTYIQTVANGVNGSGDYLVTLPNSLSFDTTLPSQQITTTNIGTNTYALMSYIIPSGSGLITNDFLGGQVYPLVYNATKFRILTTTWGSAIQCWGSGYYSLGGDDPKIQLTFRFTST